MRPFILVFALLFSTVTFASGGEIPLQSAYNDLSDRASLQAGAKLFVNYCMGCHSVQYSRFQRMGKDLGLSDEQLQNNLMFSAEKVGESMKAVMTKQDGKAWFGVAPPDLSVTARARGTDWLYTYLISFYLDSSRKTGVNNLVFKDVAMPHVLWELQGWQKPVYKTVPDDEGKPHQVIDKLELTDKDKLSQVDYDKKVADYRRTARDLVNFLDYVGEPAKLERQSLGWKVILFLLVFMVLAYFLKKEYWRDVH